MNIVLQNYHLTVDYVVHELSFSLIKPPLVYFVGIVIVTSVFILLALCGKAGLFLLYLYQLFCRSYRYIQLRLTIYPLTLGFFFVVLLLSESFNKLLNLLVRTFRTFPRHY